MADRSDLLMRMALGAAGGLVGTMVIQGLLKGHMKWLPQTLPPIKQDPGQFMVQKARQALPEGLQARIPETVHKAAAKGLGLGYGITFGALYAALRPRGGNPLLDGLALGMAAWAVGYLGWMPATGLMPPVWQHKPSQVLTPAAEHLAYGMATVATYDWLEHRSEKRGWVGRESLQRPGEGLARDVAERGPQRVSDVVQQQAAGI